MREFVRNVNDHHFTVKEGRNTLGRIIDLLIKRVEQYHLANHPDESLHFEQCPRPECRECIDVLKDNW